MNPKLKAKIKKVVYSWWFYLIVLTLVLLILWIYLGKPTGYGQICVQTAEGLQCKTGFK